MDSVTQIVLGGVVGKLVLGRQLGWKAALWGAWLGTVPDLDVLFLGKLDELERMHVHRGLSHSLFFLTLIAPLWAGLICWLHKSSSLSFFRVTWMVWLALVTHTLIDCFTIYGVEIFQPFSHWRLSFSNLFVVDPLFTLPLLVGLVFALFRDPNSDFGRKICWWGAGFALLYVGWSFSAQRLVRERCEEQFALQGIEPDRVRIMPTPGNTLLWRVLAANDTTVWIGYAGLLDDKEEICWREIPRNTTLLDPIVNTKAVQKLTWFADGYSVVHRHGKEYFIADLRFGEIQHQDGRLQPLSVWKVLVEKEDERGSIEQLPREIATAEIAGYMDKFTQRILGNRVSGKSYVPLRPKELVFLAESLHTRNGSASTDSVRLSGLLCTP